MFEDCGYAIDSQIVVFLSTHIAEARVHSASLFRSLLMDRHEGACKGLPEKIIFI